ncbi:MAG: hypothetical protein JXB14_01620 [Candidatus Altiarchaeota archaeon]|nr:hypothetical protein [Candidatus Altiarchaeota archaeon]
MGESRLVAFLIVLIVLLLIAIAIPRPERASNTGTGIWPEDKDITTCKSAGCLMQFIDEGFDPDTCESLDKITRDWCYYLYVENSVGGTAICARIQDYKLHEDCLNSGSRKEREIFQQYLSRIAEGEFDCGLIDKENLRDRCYNLSRCIISAIAFANLSRCDRCMNRVECREIAVDKLIELDIALAASQRDLKKCFELRKPHLETCIDTFILKNGCICEDIRDRVKPESWDAQSVLNSWPDHCYTRCAVLLKDPVFCENVTSQQIYDCLRPFMRGDTF